MYLVRCELCDEVEAFESVDEAQSWFNEHAAEQHPVKLERIG